MLTSQASGLTLILIIGRGSLRMVNPSALLIIQMTVFSTWKTMKWRTLLTQSQLAFTKKITIITTLTWVGIQLQQGISSSRSQPLLYLLCRLHSITTGSTRQAAKQMAAPMPIFPSSLQMALLSKITSMLPTKIQDSLILRYRVELTWLLFRC